MIPPGQGEPRLSGDPAPTDDKYLLFKHPLNLVRTRYTAGLEVVASPDPVVRGQDVVATVIVASVKRLENLEVGLFCTERYVVEDTIGNDGPGPVIGWIAAYEEWRPLSLTPGSHTVRFHVPPEAPFSYVGSIAGFRWEVIVRGRRRRRLDARVASPLSVLP